MTVGLTEALAHPDSEHVELQKSVVNALPVLQIHEKMIHEAPAPRRHRAENVTKREEAKVHAVPEQIWWDCCKDVDDWNT